MGWDPARSQAPGWPSHPPACPRQSQTPPGTRGAWPWSNGQVPKASQEGGTARQSPLAAGFWGGRTERLDAGLLPQLSWAGPRDLQVGLISSSPRVRGLWWPEISQERGRLSSALMMDAFLPAGLAAVLASSPVRRAPPRALLGWGTGGGRARLRPSPLPIGNTSLLPPPPQHTHRSWPRVPPPQTASRPHRASAGRVSGTGRGSPHWDGTVVFRDPPACLCLGALLPEQWARGQQREAAPRSPRQQGQGPEPRLCPLGFQLQVPAGGGGGTAGESRRCLDHCLLDKRAPALRPQFPHLHSQAHGLSGCELPPPQESPPLFEPRPSPGGPGPPFHRQGRWL